MLEVDLPRLLSDAGNLEASAAIDVSLLAQVFAGDRTSEFGAFENAIFLRLELFF